MNLFQLFARGPKTSEFWAAVVGTGVGLFAINQGVAALDVMAGMSPMIAQIIGRNGVKIAALVGTARGAAAQGEAARSILEGE